MTGQIVITTKDKRPRGLFLFAGVLGLAGLLAGCASTEPGPISPVTTNTQASNFTGHKPVYATSSRRATAPSTSGNFAPPAEWRTVRRSVTINTPAAPAAPQAQPYVAPQPVQPVTVPVSAAVPSSSPSVAEISKMPLDRTAPKSYAEWKGPLPTPDIGRIASLKAEEARVADQLAELNTRRRKTIKAGGSTDHNRAQIERTLEQRRSAVALLVALEGYRDNPSRTSQIRYAKTLERYNKAR